MCVHFEESGNLKGPSIIFIHGGGISSWMWQKQLDFFKHYHCITLDLPEHGSSVNGDNLSIRRGVEIVSDIIKKHARDGKAHVIGHSLGAKVAMELLNTAPKLVDHAVIASALFRPIPFQKSMHKLWVYKLTVSMMKIKWIANSSIKKFKFPEEMDEENFRRDIKSYTADRLYRIYDEVYQKLTLPEGLGKCNVKTLVISGDKELKAMKRSVEDIIRLLPKSKGIYIKNAEHNYPWTMSEVFNKAVASWIEDREMEDENIISL